MKIDHENLHYYLQKLEMEAQFQVKRTEQKTDDTDSAGYASGPDDVAEDTATGDTEVVGNQPHVDGLILPVLQKIESIPSEDEKRAMHVRAEAMYGAISEAAESSANPENKIDYKA